MKRISVTLAALLASACSLDPHANPSYCESDADCDAGQRCAPFETGAPQGLCVARKAADGSVPAMDGAVDGGTRLDSGVDGGGCHSGGSCYSGPSGTAGVGTCHAGTIDCRGGVAFCMGEVTPTDDTTCDGMDEDCNGMPDDAVPVLMECAIAQPGICSAGEVQCVSGSYSCRPVNEATSERCNGMDDDCDEVVDEDTDAPCYPSDAPPGCTIAADGSFTCTGICATGRLSCTDGSATCEGATLPASSDGCTGGEPALDDDCDGAIDQDCTEPCTDGATRTCYTGPAPAAGRGICDVGMQTCTGGTWSVCSGSVLPGVERCDNPGTDDDCNGVVDDIPGEGRACLDESAMGVCRAGATMCDSSGALSCVTPTPAAMELCDGRDDDCDGAVDESFDFMTDEDHCGDCATSCGIGRTCCSGACVDTDRDTASCGACGTMCTGSQGCCGGSCMELSNDPNNCGACGNVCSGGELCCDGACVDSRSDAAHCGACGTSCTGGNHCCDGVCADPGSTQCTACTMDCTGGQACCAPSCTELSTDASNCGACGNACPSAASTCCDSGCVNTATDAAHCGGCDMPCGGTTPDCCESGCTDVQTDVFHCGSCGNACAPGEHLLRRHLLRSDERRRSLRRVRGRLHHVRSNVLGLALLLDRLHLLRLGRHLREPRHRPRQLRLVRARLRRRTDLLRRELRRPAERRDALRLLHGVHRERPLLERPLLREWPDLVRRCRHLHGSADR